MRRHLKYLTGWTAAFGFIAFVVATLVTIAALGAVLFFAAIGSIYWLWASAWFCAGAFGAALCLGAVTAVAIFVIKLSTDVEPIY